MPNTRDPSGNPLTQREGRSPVVDQPELPRAGEIVPPARIGRRIVTMAENPVPSRAKRNTMDAFPERPRSAPRRKIGEQEPVPPADAEGPGYLRLRLRVREGEISVRSVSFVPGPLNRPQTFSAGLSYEAAVRGRRVAVGDVPDFAERRSFPDPAGRPGLQGHHLSQMPVHDFSVRIPANEITDDELSQLTVELIRWRGRGPGDHLPAESLSKEPKSAVTVVARLSGVEPSAVPSEVRAELRASRHNR
jgi:hypothetical protein